MRLKAISIIALLALCACQSKPVTNISPETQALINDHPEKRFEQECWDAGHVDKSKAFYNCMGEHWKAWREGMHPVAASKDIHSEKLHSVVGEGFIDSGIWFSPEAVRR